MKRRLLTFITTALVAALCAVCLFACTKKSDGLKFASVEDGYEISGAESRSISRAEIPAEHGGKPVTAISASAFDSCANLVEVCIPESVKFIGASAFYCCRSLTAVEIPDGVTALDEWAFGGCTSLESVTLPESVADVNANAFKYCRALSEINYGGTCAQWLAVTKKASWNYGTGEYVVHCDDGDIQK